MLRGDVLVLVPALAEVVELEHLVVERVRVGENVHVPRRAVGLGAQQPTVVIERPLAHHLEVLDLVPRRRPGVGGVEGVGEACALDGLLLDAVKVFGSTKTTFVDVRSLFGDRAGGQRGPYPAEKRRMEFCEFFRGNFAPYIA